MDSWAYILTKQRKSQSQYSRGKKWRAWQLRRWRKPERKW